MNRAEFISFVTANPVNRVILEIMPLLTKLRAMCSNFVAGEMARSRAGQ